MVSGIPLGNCYEGSFYAGKREGNFIVTLEDRRCFTGKFHNDAQVGMLQPIAPTPEKVVVTNSDDPLPHSDERVVTPQERARWAFRTNKVKPESVDASSRAPPHRWRRVQRWLRSREGLKEPLLHTGAVIH